MSPPISPAVGCTGTIVPVKPAATRLCRISDPILPALPVGADDRDDARLEERPHRRGRRGPRSRGGACSANARRDRQRQDDVADACFDASWSLPKPESRKTSSMRRLSPSTYASNVSMPCVARDASQAAPAAGCRCRDPAGIRDGERHLGAVDGIAGSLIEAGEGDDAAAGLRDERRRRGCPPSRQAANVRLA